MQQIVFRIQSPQMAITLNDVGSSKIEYSRNYSEAGGEEPHTITESLPYLNLFDFTCNSLGTSSDTATCVGMPGQHTVQTKVQPRTLAVTLAYDGRSGGRDTENQMYKLRRLIMRCFPLGIKGELEYTNSNGAYYIDCYATEYPNMERNTGTRTIATFYLVADYPYWYKNIIGTSVSINVSGGEHAKAYIVLTKGDMSSPISGTITCTASQSGIQEDYAIFIWRIDNNSQMGMRIVKPLKQGQKLIFNSNANNEIYFKLQDTDGSVRIANNYKAVQPRLSHLLRH